MAPLHGPGWPPLLRSLLTCARRGVSLPCRHHTMGDRTSGFHTAVPTPGSSTAPCFGTSPRFQGRVGSHMSSGGGRGVAPHQALGRSFQVWALRRPRGGSLPPAAGLPLLDTGAPRAGGAARAGVGVPYAGPRGPSCPAVRRAGSTASLGKAPGVPGRQVWPPSPPTAQTGWSFPLAAKSPRDPPCLPTRPAERQSPEVSREEDPAQRPWRKKTW